MQAIIDWWRSKFGRYYVVEYEQEDIGEWYPDELTIPAPLTATGGASLFGGCCETGVFTSRQQAIEFRTYIFHRYRDEWPVIPTLVTRIKPTDKRVLSSKFRR